MTHFPSCSSAVDGFIRFGLSADADDIAKHAVGLVKEAFATNPGNPGSLTFWGHDPEEHKMIADHCVAEGATLVKANGREIYEFFTRLGYELILF